MKKKKKIFIIGGILVLAAAGSLYAFARGQEMAPLPVQTSFLERASLQSTIGTSGTIESVDEVNVYADVTAPVKSIAVKVGDKVNTGDLLCQLDTKDLEESIQQKEIALRDSQAASAQRIKTTQRDYNNAKSNLDQGLNTQINSAQQQVISTQRALEDAQQKQNDAQKDLDQNLNSNLISLKAQVETAKTAFDRAERAYKDRKDEEGDQYKDLKKAVSDQEKQVKAVEKVLNDVIAQLQKDPMNAALESEKIRIEARLQEEKSRLKDYKKDLDDYEADDEGYDADDPTRQSLKQLRQAMEDAEAVYNTAKKSLAAAQSAIDQEMSGYHKAVEDAQRGYDDAVKGLKATQASVNQDLQRNLDSIASERIAANAEGQQLELKNLREDLEGCTMRAPVAGTVTAVYAVENAPASGLMFMIENTDALKVAVTIKEYDVNLVKEGMKVKITADAAEGEEYEGVLQRVAPTAVKSPVDAGSASTAKSTDVEFEAEILVTSKSEKLRIGMTADADIIVEEEADVFAVPYETTTLDESGSAILYALEQQEDGSYLPQAIPVSMGLETDYQVEVSGEGLTEGMEIIRDAKTVTPGVPVVPAGGDLAPQDGGVVS